MKGHLGFVCRRIFGPPSEPVNVGVVGELTTYPTCSSWGVASVTVSWSTPVYVGSGITFYTVTLTGVGSVIVGGGSHTFTGIEWNSSTCTTLLASVSATNAAGSGPAASASSIFPETDSVTLLDVEAEPVYGSFDTSFCLRWLPVCLGNGGLMASGQAVYDGFTHYEIQYLDIGGPIAGADGSGSYYGWTAPLPGDGFSPAAYYPPVGATGAYFSSATTAVLFATNSAYGTPYNTGRSFRVRTVRIVSGSIVAVGTWSNYESASFV